MWRIWVAAVVVGPLVAIGLSVPGSSVEPDLVHGVGLVDPDQGLWHLYDEDGQRETSLFFGNPGDYPIVGDWDCDGVETPGMYRQSDGYVYLRNSNTQGVADIRFFFGNPGDIPLAGDFDGDGCDTVSIYRAPEQRFYVIDELGENEGGLGEAKLSYVFGDPGDKPFVGDFDGDGIETAGLHRESTGLVYFRNSHTQGVADNEFIFGDPDDRLVAGDWTGDGTFTPALFRPSNTTMFFRHSNTQGNADAQWVAGENAWLPVAGDFGFGDTPTVTVPTTLPATSTTTTTSSTTTTTSSTTTTTSSTTTTTSALPPVTCATATDAVAYWCFDDETSPTDDGADGHDATVVGAQFDGTKQPPTSDNVAALRLDGVDDYTTAPDPDGVNNLDGFSGITLTAWVNPDGPQTSDGCCGAIVSKYDRGGTGVTWGLDLAGDQLRFAYPAGEWTTAGATVPSGTWSHVAGMWDGDSIHLYINGVLVGTGPNPYTTMGDTTTPVSVGSYTAFAGAGRSGFFGGLIDEVYVFDRALAPAEIAGLAGATPTQAWHADLVLQDVASGSFTRGIRWTPGLGFEPTPLSDTCASLAGGWSPAPQGFPYEVLEVTYTPGTLLRFDFEYPLRPSGAWLHDGATCETPDGQGGGLPADVWSYWFDSTLP